MDMLAILEVAIGIVLIYLILSLVCTSLLEAWIAAFGLKDKVLRDAIEKLLRNGALADSLYGDPEIVALHGPTGRRPSYIPPDVFARCILNLTTDGSWRKQGGLPSVMRDAIVAFGQADVADAATAANGPAGPAPAATPAASARAAMPAASASAAMPAASARAGTAGKEAARQSQLLSLAEARKLLADTLCKLLDDAGGDIDLFRNRIELWFDRTGDRSKGWFRRKVNNRLVGLGLAVALVVNADTLLIFQRLSDDPTLREAAVEIAREQLQAQPLVEAGAADAAPAAAGGGPALESVRRQVGEVAPFIGWSPEDPVVAAWSLPANGSLGAKLGAAFMPGLFKLIGLVLTAFAISLGAPFWFDLLQKLVNIRKSLAAERSTELKKGEGTAGGDDAEASPAAAGASAAAGRDAAPAYSGPMAGFAPTAAKLNLGNAYWLAYAANLAYERDDAKTLATIGSWGMSGRVFASKQADVTAHWRGKYTTPDTQGFIASDDHAIIVCFRGTEPTRPADVVTDLQVQAVPAGTYGEGRIHKGFRDAIEAVWPEVEQEIAQRSDKRQSVWFAGHSLGGALAVLAASRYERFVRDENDKAKQAIDEAERALEAAPDDPALVGKRQQALDRLRGRVAGLYTIGQPRVGDAAFARDLETRLGELHVRSVNNRDVVPRVPLRAMHYEHSGTVLYLDEFGRLHRDPGLWLRLLDTVVISRAEVGKAREGVQDHSAAGYVDLLDKARRSDSALTRLALAS